MVSELLGCRMKECKNNANKWCNKLPFICILFPWGWVLMTTTVNERRYVGPHQCCHGSSEHKGGFAHKAHFAQTRVIPAMVLKLQWDVFPFVELELDKKKHYSGYWAYCQDIVYSLATVIAKHKSITQWCETQANWLCWLWNSTKRIGNRNCTWTRNPELFFFFFRYLSIGAFLTEDWAISIMKADKNYEKITSGCTPLICRLSVSGRDVNKMSSSDQNRNFASLAISMTVSHIAKACVNIGDKSMHMCLKVLCYYSYWNIFMNP